MMNKSLDYKDGLILLGSQFVGKGVQRLGDWVDAEYAEGKPLQEKPSLYINMLGGAGLFIGGLLGLKKQPLVQVVAMVTGSSMLTKSTDYIEEALAPSAGFIPGATFTPVVATGGIAIKPTATMIQGKYTT